VADLVELSGSMVRDFAAHPGQWLVARRGDEFWLGESVRTGANSRARLNLRSGGALRMGAESLIRFLPGNARVDRIRMETGEAEIDSPDQEAVIETEIGTARLEQNTSLRMSHRPDGAFEIDVLIGRAKIERGERSIEVLGAGQGISLEVGGAVIEWRGKEPSKGKDEGVHDAGEIADAGSTDAQHDGGESIDSGSWIDPGLRARILKRAPRDAELTVTVGESAVIHNPQGTTAVRFAFDQVCPGEGLVELAGRNGTYRRPVAQSIGTRSAILAVSNGVHPYRFRCVKDGTLSPMATESGRLLVRRESGAAMLPLFPPKNVIDTDGRKYTILYQSHLPDVTVRWPDAPSDGRKYTLEVTGPSGKQSYDSTEPSWAFPSGALGEGSYTVVFSAGAGSRSLDTPLRIEFNNASPNAQIREPREHAAVAGMSLRVVGTAFEGSRVTVGADELPLDAHQRFNGDIALSEGQRTIAIRISHHKQGTHYYLRHLGPS
jgi:hypothetical protein